MTNTASIPYDFQQGTLRDLFYVHPSLVIKKSGSMNGGRVPAATTAAVVESEQGRSYGGSSRSSSSALRTAIPPRHVVKHHYHDHAGESEEDISLREEACSWSLLAPPLFLPAFTSCSAAAGGGGISEQYTTTRKIPPQQRSRAALRFPERLYDMLEAIEVGKELDGIVSWQPHGRCFLVRKPKAFVELVLPKYFRQSKLTSFQRQLNVYGFSRLTVGRDRGAYYHEFFLHGRRGFCKHIARIQLKGTGIKPAPSPATEPDLYEFSFCRDKVAGPSSLGVLQRSPDDESGRTLETRLNTSCHMLHGDTSFARSQFRLDPVDVLAFHTASSPVLMSLSDRQPPGTLWLPNSRVMDEELTANTNASNNPAFVDPELEPTPLAENSSLQFLVIANNKNSENSNVKGGLANKKTYSKKQELATDAFINECHGQIDSILLNIFDHSCANSETHY